MSHSPSFKAQRALELVETVGRSFSAKVYRSVGWDEGESARGKLSTGCTGGLTPRSPNFCKESSGSEL